jgi:vitamin B12 transporter
VIIRFTETKLKASYGTGFKAPTLSELFQNFPDFGFFGNLNLKPEQSEGYDAGFEQPLFDDRVRFGSTCFHNSITDLITTNDTFTSYANVNLATTEGTESFVSAKITDRVGVRADYTFTRAVDAGAGLQLLRRPKEKWSATATWLPIDAHAVGHRASRQRLARHHTRRLRIRDRGAGLCDRKPAGRLCDQRSGKNIRADR